MKRGRNSSLNVRDNSHALPTCSLLPQLTHPAACVVRGIHTKPMLQDACVCYDRYSTIGNHDILSDIEGVDEQIAYSKKNSKWVLPAR